MRLHSVVTWWKEPLRCGAESAYFELHETGKPFTFYTSDTRTQGAHTNRKKVEDSLKKR